jgi:L-lysine exporter family protein LysE/ArgO
MITFLEGLMLGFAYVMPIGGQNLFVIHSAIKNKSSDAFKVTSLVILMDISLAIACYLGIGLFVSRYPFFANILQALGGLYLFKIAFDLFRAKPNLEGDSKTVLMSEALRNAFVLTWMNPQALIDGSILLGSFNSKNINGSNYFIFGVCLASMIWFLSLTTIMRVFRNKMDNKKFKIINIICGVVLLYLGASLLINVAIKVHVL